MSGKRRQQQQQLPREPSPGRLEGGPPPHAAKTKGICNMLACVARCVIGSNGFLKPAVPCQQSSFSPFAMIDASSGLRQCW